MKRGLITWNEKDVPASVLEERLERARAAVRERGVSALVVYTDVWRSNDARSLVNFMPYWGSSLLVVPVDGRPILLCGNSPRVYPWLRSVTFVGELRPTKDFAARLVELSAERGWERVGVLRRSELPFAIEHDLTAATLELVDVPPWDGLEQPDATELAMRRTAIERARSTVEEAIASRAAETERDVAAAIERALRRAGMEDVLIRFSVGAASPGAASDRALAQSGSVFVSCEYLGHWVQLSRPLSSSEQARAHFLDGLKDLSAVKCERLDLSSVYPYRAIPPYAPLETGRLVAVHVQNDSGGYYGDTCIVTSPTSAEPV